MTDAIRTAHKRYCTQCKGFGCIEGNDSRDILVAAFDCPRCGATGTEPDDGAIRTAPTAPGGGVEATEIERRTVWLLRSHSDESSIAHEFSAGAYTDRADAEMWRQMFKDTDQDDETRMFEIEIIVREVTP